MGTQATHMAYLQKLEGKKKGMEVKEVNLIIEVKSYGDLSYQKIVDGISSQLSSNHWPFKDEDLIELKIFKCPERSEKR